MTAAKKIATYDDVVALPPNMVGQIVFGTLHAHPRPAVPHALAASALGEELGPPFKRGRGGPGGWIILDEPELHLGANVLVPDLAGWRRARMPEAPRTAYLTVAPDWACEVLSPSTSALDRGDKSKVYAREGVTHLWFVDPDARTLEVLALDGGTYRILEVHAGDAKVRAVPFDAIELDLAILWAT
ncbi:MAG: Uma2 family endonuclease [Myxococcales bacterium]|jgi:Uma2 family endonuclease|nr:Uma2 family endonuclease [Myxococcales bacterium]